LVPGYVSSLIFLISLCTCSCCSSC